MDASDAYVACSLFFPVSRDHLPVRRDKIPCSVLALLIRKPLESAGFCGVARSLGCEYPGNSLLFSLLAGNLNRTASG